MSNLISCVSWVKRGISAHQPSKYVLDEKELERVSTLARIELEDARIEMERAHNAANIMGKGAEGAEADDADEDEDGDEDSWVDEEDASMEVDGDVQVGVLEKGDGLAQYKLDEYDVKEDGTGPFSNIKGLIFYRDNQDDPYITLKDVRTRNPPNRQPPSHRKTEDDVSQLEIYVYDESQDNLYVHHDLMLPNFPLCLEWLDFPPTSSEMETDAPPKFGNYIAVDGRPGGGGQAPFGYVTRDSCPDADNADDTLHTPLPNYDVPFYVGSISPNVTADTPIDVVFLNFLGKEIIGILNSLQKDKTYTMHDVSSNSPTLASDILGLYAQGMWN
ncbi:uncharacterized protein F5891DRAFT_1275417 [Suillus fuscotomentosus]|uniref:Putative 5'-nucleotidase C-terminal domain-containing protein n=1 Tax=Suillus fuscotomentosus TaxID=1912939 RepID=A0AAD4HQH6_9AGAM|nr:uncharacterized protein F5891DRAFT_1275417 [Suillus fuscotomentosus]KAG1905067.1 hypothetical protein F5891DRAFT_1275417 [Suillus fuscotomentosus]